jgi:hypothetical protein
MKTALALMALCFAASAADTGRLVVSPNGHFLQYQDGRPFFWLADTSWLMFDRLTLDEMKTYLHDRHEKGFDVVQVMVIRGTDIDATGSPALIDEDPSKPDLTHGHWDHIDQAISAANDEGIYVGMVAAWGSEVKSGKLNESNAKQYATFLARRYRDRPNIVWILGGDIQGDIHPDVWRIMGTTLKAEDPNHLITYHPFGRMQSSMWFHNEPWLDFNMFQSGHQRYDQDVSSPHKFGEDNWRYVVEDYARKPAKPVVDGEPSYEGIPQGLHDETQPYWTAADVRRYAWWSVLAGAAGHTYGDNSIMQFLRKGDKPAYGAKTLWTEAMHDPGSGQMQYVKKLVLSRPYFERVPDQSLIAGENGTKHDYVIATRGANYLFAYDYSGKPFQIRMGAISGKRVQAWWYSPRDGSAKKAETLDNRGDHAFTPPDNNDWVLVLDDEAAKFPAPGTVR